MKRKVIKKIVNAMVDVLESHDWLIRERERCLSCDRLPAQHHTYCHNCGRELTKEFAPIEDNVLCILIDTYEAGRAAQSDWESKH